MATDERLVGTALDLLVRATLATRDGSAAPTVGALRLERAGVTGTLDVARQASDRCASSRRRSSAATAGEWHEVAKLCVLLARFEQAGRNLQAVQWSAERLRAVEPTVDAYMRTELVDAGDVDDVVAAAPVIADDHADLRVAEPLLLGPSFALSGALGGADADVIAGAVLLDLKAATTPRIVRGTGVWQIVGYALADTDDTMGCSVSGLARCGGAGGGPSASTSSSCGSPARRSGSMSCAASSLTSRGQRAGRVDTYPVNRGVCCRV